METELSKQDILRILEKESPYLQEQYGIARIALYGSFAQDTATETSNVDLHVELSRPLGFGFVALVDRLEDILSRKVSLSTFEILAKPGNASLSSSCTHHSKDTDRRLHTDR